MAFSALDAFPGIVADAATVRVAFHALAVQNSGGGAGSFAVGISGKGTQLIAERIPYILFVAFSEHRINRLPRREVRGQHPRLNATSENIKYHLNDFSAISEGAFSLFRFWQHGSISDHYTNNAMC